MAVELGTAFMDFIKGDYGFLTILVIIIIAIWGYLQIKKRRKNKIEQRQRILPEQVNMPNENMVGRKPQVQKPAIRPEPRYAPIIQQPEEPLFDLEENAANKSLDSIEKDAMLILKKKTEHIEVGLIREKQEIEKKLNELAETEKGIQEIVAQLKINYQQVKRQQKIYELMRKSLVMGTKGE